MTKMQILDQIWPVLEMIELSSTFFVICVCGVLEASKVAVFMKGENDDEGRVLSGISLKIFSRNPIQNNDKTMKGGIIKKSAEGRVCP